MGKHFLSHLAHVELITPKLDESVAFFKDVMGMDEVSRLLTQIARSATLHVASHRASSITSPLPPKMCAALRTGTAIRWDFG